LIIFLYVNMISVDPKSSLSGFPVFSTVVKINADASKRLVKELELGSVPWFRMFYNGQQIFEHSGMLTEERVTGLFESVL